MNLEIKLHAFADHYALLQFPDDIDIADIFFLYVHQAWPCTKGKENNFVLIRIIQIQMEPRVTLAFP